MVAESLQPALKSDLCCKLGVISPSRGPIAAYVGRVAVEKNVGAFLEMPWAGSKIVIGDGPERLRYQAQFPQVAFAGYRYGQDASTRTPVAGVPCVRGGMFVLGSSKAICSP